MAQSMTEFEKLTLKLLTVQMSILQDMRDRASTNHIPSTEYERRGLEELREEVSRAIEAVDRLSLDDINRTIVRQKHDKGWLVGLVFETEAAGVDTMHAFIDLVRAYMITSKERT